MRFNQTRLLAALCTILTSAVLTGQMSGTYTIDPMGSGSRNFKSFSSAVVQMWTSGVSGPTVFNVASGSYTETLMLSPIKGASTTNTITFRSSVKHGSTLTTGGIRFDLSSTANPVRGIVIDGFRLEARIWARTPSSGIEVKNCVFPPVKGTGGGVYAVGAIGWNVHHCLFDSRRFIAVEFDGFDACAIHHNEIRTNGSDHAGIVLDSSTAATTGATRIYNNLITTEVRSSTAIAVGFNAFGVEIAHNTILMNGGVCVVLGGYVTRPNKLLNNILVNVSGIVLLARSTNRYAMELDGNIYYAVGSTSVVRLGTQSLTLSQWQKLTGLDKNSLSTNPQFKGGLGPPFNLRPGGSSPANSKAVNTPAYVTDDFEGTKRRTPATIGAYEGSGTTFELFGAGCQGSGGRIPKMSYGGDLAMGSKTFSLILSNALGGSSVRAFLSVGAFRQTIPLGGGCNLLVAPHLVLPMTMGGTSGAGNGVIIYRIDLPSDPKLRGARAHFQWAVADPAAAGIGLALSQGATLTL
jgi:hypothetical protein